MSLVLLQLLGLQSALGKYSINYRIAHQSSIPVRDPTAHFSMRDIIIVTIDSRVILSAHEMATPSISITLSSLTLVHVIVVRLF